MPQPRDPLWDALTEHFGEPRTPQERSRRNRAVKELREAEATPEEIAITADYCRAHFSDYTEMAICGWLSRALHERKRSGDNVIEIAMQERRRK